MLLAQEAEIGLKPWSYWLSNPLYHFCDALEKPWNDLPEASVVVLSVEATSFGFWTN
jgi:hypothetical protein